MYEEQLIMDIMNSSNNIIMDISLFMDKQLIKSDVKIFKYLVGCILVNQNLSINDKLTMLKSYSFITRIEFSYNIYRDIVEFIELLKMLGETEMMQYLTNYPTIIKKILDDFYGNFHLFKFIFQNCKLTKTALKQMLVSALKNGDGMFAIEILRVHGGGGDIPRGVSLDICEKKNIIEILEISDYIPNYVITRTIQMLLNKNSIDVIPNLVDYINKKTYSLSIHITKNMFLSLIESQAGINIIKLLKPWITYINMVSLIKIAKLCKKEKMIQLYPVLVNDKIKKIDVRGTYNGKIATYSDSVIF